ncbi:glycosyl hydrolase 108 family protein [Tardibacter chloracetimidivorans]|uniref:glycosyl hydrolase 108 family protein n=1 Tax=Tardibacter chloracetimidivorans TaxID=1921510 RepID=UPI0009FAECB5|nr:glycosyl hydrolase 108 family protein [Tardibacter chloracetimidivorans]
MNIESELNALLHREGGYVNNPNDTGGETNWGITRGVAVANGYSGPMKDLPLALERFPS